MRSKTEFVIAFNLVLIFFVSSNVYSLEKNVHNSLKEITACEGKINLSLIKEWGGEEVTDIAYAFYGPKDIEIRNDNLLTYICDSGNNRIQIFDNTGRFRKTIGRIGQGPGEFNEPLDIALDNQNNVVVADFYNSRIQILNGEGSFLGSFKISDGKPSRIAVTNNNKIAIYDYRKTFNSSSLLSLYDYKGKIIGEIGKHIDYGSRKPNYPQSLQSPLFTKDRHDNFYVTYACTPYLEKYSQENKSLMVVTFDIPFKVPKYQFRPVGYDMKIIAEKVSAGISVGEQGRIYLVVTTRPEIEKEKKSRSRTSSKGKNGSRIIVRKPTGVVSEATDLYRLLVFDSKGKIIAAKKLDVYCDKINVYKDRLFIIDTYVAMKIYEYKMSFR